MRSLLIYTTTLEDDYTVYYERLASELSTRGVETFLAMPPDALVAPNTFSGALRVGPGWERMEGPISIDAIFNKSMSRFATTDGWIINHPVLDAACDKDSTAEIFANFCPRSVFVQDSSSLADAVSSLRTDTIVVKPTASYGGQGVWIGKKGAFPGPKNYPVVMQEFIDTAGGITGICDGRHDLRLISFGGKLVDCYVRQPAKDGFLSNVAQGGSIKQVPLEIVPTEAKKLAAAVDGAFANFPDRVYSVDMGRDADGSWKLIELNSPPGLAQHEDEIGHHIPMLAEFLARAMPPTDPTIVRP